MKTLLFSFIIVSVTLSLHAQIPAGVAKTEVNSFGQTIYYDSSGNRIGQSEENHFGQTIYYDSNGKRVGNAEKNSLGETIYYDSNGKRIW